MNPLLNLTGCKNNEELNANVPICTTLANTEITARLGLFQAAINAFLGMQDIECFSVMTTMTMFTHMLAMEWDVVIVDSLHSGWLGNPNIFSPWDKEATSALNV